MSTSQKHNIIEVDSNLENYLDFDKCQNIDDETTIIIQLLRFF